MFGTFWGEYARIQCLVEIGKARDEQLDALLKSFPGDDESLFDCHDSRRRLKNLDRNLGRKDHNRNVLLKRDAAQISLSGVDSPLSHAINGEHADILRRAVGDDWPLLRDTLDGQYEAIARNRGMSVGTLKSRVSRAKTKLRCLLLTRLDG